MNIKRTVEMDLIELLTWAKDNGKTGEFIGVDDNYRVFISYHHGWVQTDNGRKIPKFETKFKITEEVEITEETVLPRLACVHSKTNNISCYNDISLKRVMGLARFDSINYKLIYLQNPDGSIGELIWTKQKGMVD